VARRAGQVIEFTLTESRMRSQLAMKPGEDVSQREFYAPASATLDLRIGSRVIFDQCSPR
jgi:hypothetical protein